MRFGYACQAFATERNHGESPVLHATEGLPFRAALLALGACHVAAADDGAPDCLFAFKQGDEKVAVEPCGADTKGIGADVNVLKVMRTFGIPTDVIAFQACPGGRFYVMPDGSDAKRYLVRYPSDATSNYLSPIVHELAHVVQMRNAGGLAALNPKETASHQLGADSLAGLAFNSSLSRLNSLTSKTNLQLVGSYKVGTDDHGHPCTAPRRSGPVRLVTPIQRTTIIEALKQRNANDTLVFFAVADFLCAWIHPDGCALRGRNRVYAD